MKDHLIKTSTLIVLFVISVALVTCFMAFTPFAGGVLLDNLGPAAASQQLLAEMSDAQKTVRFRRTLGLDITFPPAYGCFFVGLTLKSLKRSGMWLGMPLSRPCLFSSEIGVAAYHDVANRLNSYREREHIIF